MDAFALIAFLLIPQELDLETPPSTLESSQPLILEEGPVFPELAWRSIGPTSMGGRVVDIDVHPLKKRIFYVASASGGVFKTTNNGMSFDAVFENEGSSSIGAVAVSQSQPDIVWVGTGEANARNSVSWGDGVYCSEDGGETWEHRGLRETRHVGQIAIHPEDENIVYIAAVGRTWGPNEERGLFRTHDAGKTWERVLYVDEETGCIDVRIDPEQPEIVYAATYQRQRDAFDGGDPEIKFGPGSGIWRSVDGGQTWERLTKGLPTRPLGRIGLDIYAKDPRILFAIVETDLTGRFEAPKTRSKERVIFGVRGENHESGYRILSITDGESADRALLRPEDIVTQIGERKIDGYDSLVQALRELKPGQRATVSYLRDGQSAEADVEFLGRPQDSRAQDFGRGMQGGQVANAQGDQGEEGFESGGVFRSDDRGTTWTRINSLNPRPFYYSQVRVAPSDESLLYVLGISFHRSVDGGGSFDTRGGRGTHPDHHALWIDPDDPDHMILGNDGGIYITYDRCRTWAFIDRLPIAQFYNIAVDNSMPYYVYGGLQDNGSWGGPSATRGSRGVLPTDWVRVNGGDGFHCAVDPDDTDIVYAESQNGGIVRVDMRTGQRLTISRPQRDGSRRYRYNWNTPFFLSPHNPRTLYFAANVVCRSIDRGDTHEIISPKISRSDRGSATALAQSTRSPHILYVGTDDGALHVTTDGGKNWNDIYRNLPDLPGYYYISDIECSHEEDGVVYVAVDAHRSDVFTPYLFVSDDFGETFDRIGEDLPEGSIRTVVEHPDNPDLLFIGTEFGCFVSTDGGDAWAPFASGLPTVAVHDLMIHSRDQDLIAGTHGRGIWIVDISPLDEIQGSLLAEGPHLFDIEDVHLWHSPPSPQGYSALNTVPNPSSQARIYYSLAAPTDEDVEIEVRDPLGRTLRTLEGNGKPGLQSVQWDLRIRNQARRGRGGGNGRPTGRGRRVEPGDYAVTLRIGEETRTKRLRVLPDPLEVSVESISAR